MSLTELAFYIESVRLHLTPELHLHHDHAGHNPFLGLVPVRVQYYQQYGRRFEPHEKDGNLRYDLGKQIFITALSDFVPTDSKNTELLEKYAQGMWDVAQAYSALLCFKPLPHRVPTKPFITQKHFYRNSEGEWRDLGLDKWLWTYSDEELEAMANKVK